MDLYVSQLEACRKNREMGSFGEDTNSEITFILGGKVFAMDIAHSVDETRPEL